MLSVLDVRSWVSRPIPLPTSPAHGAAAAVILVRSRPLLFFAALERPRILVERPSSGSVSTRTHRRKPLLCAVQPFVNYVFGRGGPLAHLLDISASRRVLLARDRLWPSLQAHLVRQCLSRSYPIRPTTTETSFWEPRFCDSRLPLALPPSLWPTWTPSALLSVVVLTILLRAIHTAA